MQDLERFEYGVDTTVVSLSSYTQLHALTNLVVFTPFIVASLIIRPTILSFFEYFGSQKVAK